MQEEKLGQDLSQDLRDSHNPKYLPVLVNLSRGIVLVGLLVSSANILVPFVCSPMPLTGFIPGLFQNSFPKTSTSVLGTGNS